jgi:hypothetical protein
VLEFVKVATGQNYCVYRSGRQTPDGDRLTAWVGSIRPTGPGIPKAPEFHPRTPMGWPAAFEPTEDEKQEIKKFLLTLAGTVVD